eukprot:TRINITY_DN4677_c0_g1_i2.p2 TRINITY_DN4677_c0_g1~~TRINITY_DN4677_c0_g1_i2.p2  ORF type:complete len:158 (+),score=27.36 TRINITY_DN4677_c0_g1_i2:587-1060(+)
MRDSLLDWNDALPEDHFLRAETNARLADLALCLGTSLQIRPACNLPARATRANGKQTGPGKMVIVNLQKTPQDRHASILIHARCDHVMQMVMHELGIDIPPYDGPSSVAGVDDPLHQRAPLPDRQDARTLEDHHDGLASRTKKPKKEHPDPHMEKKA